MILLSDGATAPCLQKSVQGATLARCSGSLCAGGYDGEVFKAPCVQGATTVNFFRVPCVQGATAAISFRGPLCAGDDYREFFEGTRCAGDHYRDFQGSLCVSDALFLGRVDCCSHLVTVLRRQQRCYDARDYSLSVLRRQEYTVNT